MTADETVYNLWDICWDVRAQTPREAGCDLTHFGVVWSFYGCHVELAPGLTEFMAKGLRRPGDLDSS